MNNRVVLIVILVVAGAILYSSMKKEGTSDSATDRPSREWSSKDEISLTADAIIGELDEEAMEALPSDLKPNTNDLNLTDEEKTELFAILNSVTESGVLGALGAASPLGASAMKGLLKTKAHIVHKIRDYKNRATSLKKQMSKTKSMSQRVKMVRKLGEYGGVVKRNEAALRTTVKKINQLKAKEKAKANANIKAKAKAKATAEPTAARGSSARIAALMEERDHVVGKLRALEKAESDLKKKVKVVAARLKAKKISSIKALTYRRGAERKFKAVKKQMESYHKGMLSIERAYQAENQRIASEKKADLAKARETKKARDKEVAAKKLLEKSKADAAAKEASAKKAKARDATRALEAKREAEHARKMALARKAHNEKVAEAERARLQVEEARAKKEADSFAKKAASVKRAQAAAAEKAKRDKAALDLEHKKNRERRDAEQAKLRAAEEKQRKQAAEALKKAESIRTQAVRKKVQEKIQREAVAQKKRREEAAKKIAQDASQEEKKLRDKEQRLAEAFRKKAAAIRRQQQEIARREEMAKAKALKNAAKAAQMAADRKQRELDQKKRDQQAKDLKQNQLNLEKKKEAARAKAASDLEKSKKDVAAKKADLERKRLDKIKAEAAFRKHKAEQAERAKKKQAAELEKGVQRITGMTTSSLELSGLDKTVLLELKVFVKASGGHRLLPAIVKMIELKSRREEEKQEKQEKQAEEEEAAAAADDGEKPMTEGEKRMKMRNDFVRNVKQITGIEPDGIGSLIALDVKVQQELLEYIQTLGPQFKRFEQRVEEAMFTKGLVAVGKENGVMITPGGLPDHVDWGSVTIVAVDKLIEFVESASPQLSEQWLIFLRFFRGAKMAKIVAEKEAVEEERAEKRAKELEAIETARVLRAGKDLEQAATKLEEQSEKLNNEIVRVDQAVSEKKQRVVEQHQREVESIEEEHEKEKQVIVKEIEQKVKEAEEELVVETREQLQDIDDAAERKVEDMKREQEEVEDVQRAEALKAAVAIEAEISNTQDQAVREALKQNLEDEQTARARASDDTRKAHALEQQAVVEEARALKLEAERSAAFKIEKEKVVAREEVEAAVESVEQDKQDLIQKREKIQEIEVEQVDLEGSIHTDVLEQEKREVEEDKEIVRDTTTDDVVQETVHPRASKEDRVVVSRKSNPNGSSFIKMSVPSDLSPGESDEISVFLKKEVVDLLAQYHRIHKKIGEEGSLDDVSAEDKSVLASAGAEFKLIREQYVTQRRQKVMARRETLVAQI